MKWACAACGYVHDGAAPPYICPVCRAPREKLVRLDEGPDRAQEQLSGAAGADAEVFGRIREILSAETSRAGLYLAMGRAADREGRPEAGQAFARLALEEAGHASRLCEMIGEGLSASTKENLAASLDASEAGVRLKKEAAVAAADAGLGDVHDALLELCRDDIRHGQVFAGLLDRYFS